MTNLTLEVAKDMLYYDKNLGSLRWKKSPNGRAPMDSVAGCVHRNGYRYVRIGGTKYLAHRVVWLLATGHWPEELDHIDGDRENNSIDNLRLSSRSENACNRGAQRNSLSGVKGVSFVNSKWWARIKLRGVSYGAYFKTLEEAKEWIEFVREELHGTFANHNNFEVSK